MEHALSGKDEGWLSEQIEAMRGNFRQEKVCGRLYVASLSIYVASRHNHARFGFLCSCRDSLGHQCGRQLPILRLLIYLAILAQNRSTEARIGMRQTLAGLSPPERKFCNENACEIGIRSRLEIRVVSAVIMDSSSEVP